MSHLARLLPKISLAGNDAWIGIMLENWADPPLAVPPHR